MPNEKEQLDDKDREILLWVALGLSFDAKIFNQRIKQEINRLGGAGLVQSAIATDLASDLANRGRIFGELRNSIRRGIVGGINQAFRRTSKMGGKLRWITVSSNVCSDCASRSGQVDTWEGWTARGMPGSGWSVCKEFCYCQLIPEDIEIEHNIQI